MIGTGAERVAKGKVVMFGLLLVAFMAASLLAAKPAHAVTTFTVNQTGDGADANLTDNVCDARGSLPGSQCTLRAAIEQANATANSGGSDLIKFAIPGNGPHTIAPASQLPTITEAVTIDGYTQGDGTSATTDDATENTAATGTNAVLKIVLNGANAPPTTENQGMSGLFVSGGGTTIKGLVINGFREANNGSEGEGIFLVNQASNTNNLISGNFIGTNAAGDTKVSNEGAGVLLVGGSSTVANTIGGTALADRNLISGNLENGVHLASNDNFVQNNLIGTDKTGTSDLGNGDSGVAVFSDSNTVGGNASQANTIAFNASDGVTVFFDPNTGNRIQRNSIFSNDEQGIDLFPNGPNANDLGDADAGANNLQNFPEINSAKTKGQKTTIKGNLDSTPATTFTLQFFSNPSGTDEGKKFIGETSVATDSSGNAAFTFKPSKKVKANLSVTATATNDSTGDTSEFSAAVPVS